MKRRLLVAAPIIVFAALGLSGCGVADAVSPPVASALYETPADAASAAGALALPSWVPADASHIRLITLSSKNAAIMTYAVTALTPTGEACTADQAARLTTMEATWWPQSLPAEGITCTGDWHIFNLGPQIYAWKA